MRGDGAGYRDSVEPRFFDSLLDSRGIADLDLVGGSAPLAGHLEFVPIGVADLIYNYDATWWRAGVAGALMAAVFNYAVSSALTWRR